MEHINFDKTSLRNTFLEKRNAISPKEKLKWDDLLLIQFQRLSFSDVHTLLSFWPMPHNNEPNTILFTNYLRHTIPDLEITYPVSDFDNYTMQAVSINEGTIYQQNKYHIIEPQNGENIEATSIDLIFVPLLIFDNHGFRVGYGKGFYDRFLSTCREDILKVGFSYFPPVENIKDVHKFDLPLDYCITTDSVYEF
ncbi:5-formyltetrahydrofolate cyclo-ligase [Arachidicoccus sp.]|uniref:5-formyltetrahydrofolate cyclo-ligase n=1 Tax=Arachidicoccus sp. TaxID=1872624 RepID=UPI003D19399C